MSHYAVAVFTTPDQDIDDLLAPYDEDIRVAPYVSSTKEDLIKQAKECFQRTLDGPYAEWQKDPASYEAKVSKPEHIQYLKEDVAKMRDWSDEDFYQNVIAGYDSNELSFEGGVLSTYNPNSKWDWYMVGGRFSGMLIWDVENPELRMQLQPDSGSVSEINFEAMRKRVEDNLVPYEEAMTSDYLYKEEYMRALYPDEADYIRRRPSFYTYAVITPDGLWHAPGEMGWFGISSESHEQRRDWELCYHERFIKPAIENNWVITIVDCHT